jgi:hypothetical protein
MSALASENSNYGENSVSCRNSENSCISSSPTGC